SNNSAMIAPSGHSDTVSIRLGDGLGGFGGSADVVVDNDPISVAIGDFNRDGKQDLVVANYLSTIVSIRLGDGLGCFSSSTDLTVANGPVSVAIGDFNGDGKQDLAIAHYQSNIVSIRLGQCIAVPTPTPTPTPAPSARPPRYTITYDGNGNTGGTPPVDPNNPYNAGSLVGVLGPGSLVNTGYMFTGWNTVANGSGTRYPPAQVFIINANTTLYAQWIVPPCAPAGLDPSFDGDGKVTT